VIQVIASADLVLKVQLDSSVSLLFELCYQRCCTWIFAGAQWWICCYSEIKN